MSPSDHWQMEGLVACMERGLVRREIHRQGRCHCMCCLSLAGGLASVERVQCAEHADALFLPVFSVGVFALCRIR